MGNLFASLLGAAGTLNVYDRQLASIQNNIANASTPGYAKQIQTLSAKRQDLDHGLPGGVQAGPVVSTRSEFAEQSVQAQFSQLGFAEQKATDLARLESLFDLTSNSGVPGALTSFFQSFSQLSVNPNDTVARQATIDNAGQLADMINQAATGVAAVGTQASTQVRDIVDTVNRLGRQLQDLNATYRQNFESQSDSGLEASLHATLEGLSEYVGFSTIREPDGTTSVYLGGQVPLVVGDRIFPLSADQSGETAAVLDSTGRDVTAKLTSGKLGGALSETNVLIPSYLSDLDTLASALADKVNAQLQAGVDATGAPPTVDLFTYDPSGGAARSLRVTTITPDQIAAATASAPGGNANALDVAALQNDTPLNGYTFTGYFGSLGGKIGSEISAAQKDNQTQQAMLAQARNLRTQLSGVSINDEAAELIQVQRAYQAGGKLISVINSLMDTVVNIIR